MQAVLSVAAIKPFTRALTALSRYGDDLDIHATPEYLSLSSTNSSKSAYGRFRIAPEFFEKYKVGQEPNVGGMHFAQLEDDAVEVVQMASGQITTKSILSILKQRGLEKNVEKCEIAILDGSGDQPPRASGTTTSSQGNGLASILMIRLHCNYGVKKTHRLSLSPPPPLVAPNIPQSAVQSKVVVGPRAFKDLIDHFTMTKGKGGKPGDLQLVWEWGATEVKVRTMKGLGSGAGDNHISTSIVMEADEFDRYDVAEPPTTLSFHLREFLAATNLAESLSLSLNLLFSDAGQPLTIAIDSDAHESFFVLSTKQAPGASTADATNNALKRTRAEETPVAQQGARRTKAVAVVQDAEGGQYNRAMEPPRFKRRTNSPSGITFQEVPVSSSVKSARPGPSGSGSGRTANSGNEPQTPTPKSKSSRQLFHPITPSQRQPSEAPFQMTQADRDNLKAAGLGVDGMTEEEVAAMFDDDDEMEAFGQPEKDSSIPRWDASASTAKKGPGTWLGSTAVGDNQDIGEAERMEMDLDPDADEEEEEEEDESFLPLTQFAPRTNERQFEALDFGDD